MKRYALLFLALLGPGCFAACFYLDGLGVFPQMGGFMLALGCLFCGVPVFSALLAFLCSKSWSQRTLIFSGLLVLQVGLVFFVLPPGAHIEMVGISHRLRQQPIQQLHDCSLALAQRFDERSLATNATPPELYPPFWHCAAIVAESELPQELRGRFRCVGLSTDSGDIAVYFECEPQIGIVCTERAFKNDASHRQIADNVYAYHYQRK